MIIVKVFRNMKYLMDQLIWWTRKITLLKRKKVLISRLLIPWYIFVKLLLLQKLPEFSKDGHYFYTLNKEVSLNVYDAENNFSLFYSIPIKIFNFSVSPHGTYVVTWSKPIENEPNLMIWNIKTSINFFLYSFLLIIIFR